MMRERGVEATPFTCRRGDAFIWHAGLVHGGTPIAEPDLTTRRASSCTTAPPRTKTSRTAGMRVRDGDGWRVRRARTQTVIERDHGRGLDNPLRT